MCSFKSIYFVIFILNLYKTQAEISDKRLCIDQECNEPVSLAKTLLRYSSPDPRILSFAPNAEVTIYSKEAGSETNLWGAAIKGRRGYVPKHLVREYKLYKRPTLLVDTELNQKPQVPQDEKKNDIDPDNVKQAYEVVDGTTIFLNPQDNITPSSTESPILSTALPPVKNSVEQTAPVDAKEDTAKKENSQDSVLNKVSSTFSKWMNDDTDSKEAEAEDEDDDEEGDEDEDDEEEESLEEDEQTENKQTQNIDPLQNLPFGIKVSPYSLEIDQPLKEANKEDELQKSTEESNKSKSITNKEETVAATEKQTDEKLESEKTEEIPTESENNEQLDKETNIKSADEIKPEPEEGTPVEPRKDEQLNKESANIISESVAQPVTEPSTGVEEEQLPFLDITTPDPSKIKGQENSKFKQVITSSQNLNISNTSDNVSDTSETIVPVSVDSPPNIPVENQKVTVNEGENSLDNIENDLVKETGNKEENVDEATQTTESNYYQNYFSGVSAKNTEEQHRNETNEVNSEKIAEEVPNVEKAAQEIPNDEETAQEVPNDEETAQEVPNDEETVQEAPNVEETVQEAPNVEENVQEVPSAEEIAKEIPDSQEIANNSEETIQNTLEENPSTENVDVSQETDEEVNNFRDEILIDDQVNEKEENRDNYIQEEINSEIETEEQLEISLEEPIEVIEESGGIWSGLFSIFESNSDDPSNSAPSEESSIGSKGNEWVSEHPENPFTSENYCDATSNSCGINQQKLLTSETGFFNSIELKFNSDFFLLLITTAGSVIIFLFVYMALDRHKREAPLVARINKLEKELLITLKENELLQEKGASVVQEIESIPNEVVEQLTQKLTDAELARQSLWEKVTYLEAQLEEKAELEDQIESLEKELETSTEVGMELNRIISEMLDPTNGSDRLKENVEQLQRQLLEQKDTINTISDTLQEKEAENRTLRLDLERSKKVANNFQNKVEEMVEKILKIEREKDQQQNSLQSEISVYQQKYNEAVSKEEVLNNEIQVIRVQLVEAQRQADIKTKEYDTLKESLNKLKALKNDNVALKSLLDATSIKAEIQQLKAENATYAAQLQQEQAVKVGFEKKYQAIVEEITSLKEKYEQADKAKVEANSRLEVLNNYFKKRESELQEEIIKYKSIWDAKEGEATSTTERIKYMQEEIENYKAQNETLKQEIISQEIDLKSQISMLEKKVHENWVTARQTERKLEDAKQEAAQLRNRLTLRERAINEERIQNRLQSPVEQNGELPLSPHTIDSPASPPLLYGARDHITKSPPIPGLPPFLPPPPGGPFMPPPLHGMPPFMPPPPSMFPGDHRPPPLGRMSSPPLNSRYSPDTSAFSPYSRRSPSPPYDSEYGASPPPIRGYSPYNSRDDRRDYKRPPHGRTNGRNGKGAVMSSGSDHSNDSLDKINRKQSKMV